MVMTPIFKICPFMDALIHHCRDEYTPERELSIDESMVGYKGRLSFIQYLLNKSTKWGMTCWQAVIPSTGGCTQVYIS